ncbi:MAG: dihydroorotate dehydrogenase [Candidatus Aenigmatarchaeota archaeon]
MMRKVCDITKKYGIKIQVLTERVIKCAQGFCGSCDLGGYRICKEGPVFDSEKILETEFGKWTRAKSGKRIKIKDEKEIPLEEFFPEYDEFFEMELFGIKFSNPFMNSSGFGVSGKLLYRYVKEGGAGAIVTKSVCLEEREGFDGPNFFELKKFTPINAMGLPNPGIENMKPEIEDMKKANVPIILSIFGKSPEEYEKVAEIGLGFGVNAIEVNISCPHTEVASIEENPDLVKEVTKRIAKVSHPFGVPVLVKVSPNSNYIDVAKAAEEGWANGIVAINTLRYKPINKKLNVKMLGSSSGFGGISGKGIKKLSEKILKDLHREIELPIISAGGIFDWKDALKRFTS